MESSQRMLLVRTLECCVSQAIDVTSFSCFNAFSRVDVRVDVKIPGGVHAYVIDLRGERCVPLIRPTVECQRIHRHNATPEIWQETYLSAILRAILYSDDPTYWLECYRKVDPITTPESELRFLTVAEELFSRGTYSRQENKENFSLSP